MQANFFSYSAGLILLMLSFLARGEQIITCPVGMKYQGSTCYEPCRSGYEEDSVLCRKSCKSGFSWKYGACSKWGGLVSYYPDNYQRNTAEPQVCNSSSFSKTIPDSASPARFTMLFASDPQIPWWFGARRADCNTDACVKEKSYEANGNQVQAMNNIVNATHTSGGVTQTGIWPSTSTIRADRRGQEISDPLGVVINGDLTAFWHDWQVEKYMDFYHRNDSAPLDSKNLKLNLYPGLGNHDYANNKNDCWWSRNLEYAPLGANGCAKNAAHYIKKTLSCNLVSNFPSSTVTSFDDGSLAYSWDIGRYHFIQLHNYPTYTYNEIGLSDAIQWLRGDLQKAHDAGQKIVLNMHDYGEHMRRSNIEFLEAIAGKRVVALFAGHIHESNGYAGTITGTNIPVFRSGSSDYSTFLLVEFGEDYFTVSVISSEGGTPRIMNPGSTYKTRTVNLSP